MVRGFSAVGLYQPKNSVNVGGAMRAATCYGACFVAMTGTRFRRNAADTTRYERHSPLFRVDDLFSMVPFGCEVIGVDLVKDAKPLPAFVHPHKGFYIFGPEDGTLGAKILDRCHRVVMIPMTTCMNLAATVNVVLYDRLAKEAR